MTASGILDRLGLLAPEADEAIQALLARTGEDGVETVRFLFSDQHGILRGKAVVADAVESACRNGITVPSSIILKDPSHRTVFPVWGEDAGFGEGVLTGAGDLLLVPDPASYRRVPWSPHSAWVLCDIVGSGGDAIPFASRTVLRRALDRLQARGLDMVCGLEVEFHIFRVVGDNLTHGQGGMPGAPPATAPLNHGYQLLTDTLYSAVEEILDDLRRNAVQLGLPVRSVEVEFGPSQFEVTFDPAPADIHADNMVLFRTMAKEVCARRGLHATFMCRPPADHSAASGWHVHQSIVDRRSGTNLFIPEGDELTPTAAGWIAGLLAHAEESCLVTTPTVNGYRRYQPNQLAPDRVQWGRDNRGAMLRALMGPGNSASRLENRVPEPAANPHFVLASQILSGLSGLESGLIPPDAVETPYRSKAKILPKTLGQAIDAFANGELYAAALGPEFKSYLTRLKTAEWERYLSTLSEWESREYLGVF